MSQTKEALIRYRIINRLLVQRKEATLRDFQEAIEDALGKTISERTIKRDIEAMRYDVILGFEAPIRYDTQDKVYYYSEKGYSIDKLPLSKEEMNTLFFVRGILEQFRHSDILQNVEGAVQKIADHLRIREKASMDELADYIDFENVPGMRGSEYLGPLLDAIIHKQVVRLTYQAFNNPKAVPHVLHPYLLKEYRNRWYVFGYEEYWDDHRIYGLDRISGIQVETGSRYILPKVPAKEYFRNIIGVTRFEDSKPERIVLRFSRQQAPYILSMPIHPSQETLETNEDYITISLHVHTSPELEILLLGWHSEVEVLEPAHLRKEIAALHEKAAGLK